MALVDQEDPAFLNIAGVLHEMRCAGIEFDEQVVKTAVALGRGRHKGSWVLKGAGSPAHMAADGISIVYYIRRADLVKIGTTKRPAERFAALLPDEILAWEPGSHSVESMRHEEFSEWRLGGSEYFRANEVLSRHIEQLLQLHGEPNPEWPTLASVNAIRVRRSVPLATPEDPAVVTLAEGVDVLGIRRNTADGWVHRKSLLPVGKNELGHRVFLLAHMRELAERSGLIQGAAVA